MKQTILFFASLTPSLAYAQIEETSSTYLVLPLVLAFTVGALFYAKSIWQWLGQSSLPAAATNQEPVLPFISQPQSAPARKSKATRKPAKRTAKTRTASVRKPASKRAATRKRA